MKANEQTVLQIERALRKVAAKFPANVDNPPLTDIYIQVKQEGGELRIYNDSDEELTRCVVEEWIGNNDECFMEKAENVVRSVIERNKDWLSELGLLKPYSFVLTDDEHEVLTDLFLVDDDTIMIYGDLMSGLSDDLDAFWEHLSSEE